MKDNKENKKDILNRIKEFPEVQPSVDFLERVHSKIEKLKKESNPENVPAKDKRRGNGLKSIFGKRFGKYLVPAFGIILLGIILYYFLSDEAVNKGKEIITGNNGNYKMNSELLGINEIKLLDSLLKEQKKILDNTVSGADSILMIFAENNGRNFNRIFSGIYGIKVESSDTMTTFDIQKAGIGSELDKKLKIRIEELDAASVEMLIKELKKNISK